jgi:mRNA interferase MazF
MAGGNAYTGKPRPAVIVQDTRYTDLRSVTVCPLTSELMDVDVVRLRVEPSPLNGLRTPSQVMIDKIVTVPRGRLGHRIGELSEQDMIRIGRALVVFLCIGA